MGICEVKFGIVFRKDGLNEVGVREGLDKLGGKVFDTDEGIIVNDDTGAEESVKILYVDASLASFMRIKMEMNLLEDRQTKHIYWPMSSYEEKLKAMEMEGAI